MIFDLQKANIWKRISAYILDLILLCIVATGGMFALSALTGFDGYSEKLDAYYAQYAAEYGLESFDITPEQYDKMSEEERATYQSAYEALTSNQEVLRTYSMVTSLILMITSLGILLAHLLLEFVLPLILKNGQTVGKRVFGIALCRRDCVRVTTFMMFVRTLIGKYTIETMFPLLLLLMFFLGTMGVTAIIIPALLILVQLVLLLVTKNHTVIHDAFAQTVAVDMASQKIFNSTEELVEYKKALHADEVSRSSY